MRELSLFTGAGGGILGTKLLGWTPIGYVEFNDYCQRVLAQRIKDGHIENAPIFGDIRAFIGEGYARAYKGMVDVVTAGFPCQPFSVAGKGLGADDPRNMWPATLECINVVQPQYAFLENVPGLLSSGYFGRILGDLAESGYDCRWRVLGADDCGGPHTRKRIWILATNSNDKYKQNTNNRRSKKETGEVRRQNKGTLSASLYEVEDTNSISQRIQGGRKKEIPWEQGVPWGESIRRFKDLFERSDIPQPLLRRMDDGLACGVDRIKAIGNGQVPAVVATAWELLTENEEN